MIVITIAGILAAVAIPSYQNMVKNNCMTTSANTLIASLQFARSEAVRNRVPVHVQSTDTSNSSNDWGIGWNIWKDDDGNGTMASSELIRVVELTCGQTTIDETSNEDDFIYRPTGFLDSTTAGGTFQVCDDRTAETGREISLSPTGRPKIDSTFTCS